MKLPFMVTYVHSFIICASIHSLGTSINIIVSFSSLWIYLLIIGVNDQSKYILRHDIDIHGNVFSLIHNISILVS